MSDSVPAPSRVGIEIGGTFTDLVHQRPDGSLSTTKVPSTPGAIHEAVLDAIAEADLDLRGIAEIVHGSTVATNAMLTRDGAATGLITTAGFRDVVEIGTHSREGHIYDIVYRKPRPPVRRALVAEVTERIGPDGGVLTPLDEPSARAAIRSLAGRGVRSVAICLLHAYANPAHEQDLLALAREEAPEIAFYASHAVLPEFREYERTVTTTVNAFIGPIVGRYIARLGEAFAERGHGGAFQIMQSNGGVLPAAQADAGAVRMMLSGPAAGVCGALYFARRNGFGSAITFDMGGTSTDVGIAPGLVPRMVQEVTVDGLPIRIPTVDLATVGAGGGSIALVDPGGFLAVGPRSAGAHPGPACYGRGGDRPTVTDAQLVAGLLRPGRRLGGRLKLDLPAAERALARLEQPGGIREAADSVLRMVNASMAQAVRLVSTSRGIDPRDFVMVAYGGGGPLHAAFVAEEIGMRQVLVPWSPGLGSAFGLLVADTVVDLSATRLAPIDNASWDAAAVARLQARATQAAFLHGIEEGWTSELGLDLRYVGQAFELTLWLGEEPIDAAALRARFDALHAERYGYHRASLPVETVTERIRILRRLPALPETPAPPVAPAPPPLSGTVRLDGREVAALFVTRETLPAGHVVPGPAVIEEASATTVVPEGWSARILPSGDLLLERAADV